VYLKSLAILSKVDILMNDFNSYGALFHLDKGWQRDRRKRMEQLAQLKSPSAFRNFLNDEMQKISLAIARVNMTIEKAEDQFINPKVKQEFASGCSELIDQLQALEQNVKAVSREMHSASKDIADTSEQPTEEKE
jgi:phospholipid/cholesterol/gamma-HCH transport system substrate-binding protein